MTDYRSLGVALIFFLDTYLWGTWAWWLGIPWAIFGLLFVWVAFCTDKPKGSSQEETQNFDAIEELKKRGM